MAADFGPDEGLWPLAELPLDGCRYCGVITKREHFQRWAPEPVGWHTWVPLTQPQIKERMLARRAARRNAQPAVYHAITAWAADSTGEEGIPFCADCKTDSCRQWIRIQARLDQQQWGIPRKHPRAVSGWWDETPAEAARYDRAHFDRDEE